MKHAIALLLVLLLTGLCGTLLLTYQINRLVHEEYQAIYDDLVSHVKRFQLSQGLVPDGIIGPHTVILLQTATQSGDPLLVHTKEAG